jgi:energy-coupling factor transport system permease protein
MISDITLGQYFPGKSLVHRFDPRTKLLLAVLYITVVFVSNNPVSFVILTAVTLSLVFISGISFKTLWKSIKPILVILIFTAAINVFMTVGEGDPLIKFGFIKIYTEGIVKAFFMAYRVAMVIMGTSILLTYTTTPISLTDGIESLLSPLKKLNVPVHSFAMMMSIALRFIPTLIEETEKIMNAQKSRGADFANGTLTQRAKALIPILIPLFASSFKRAEELATAMECRCYRGDNNRTKLVKLEFKKNDYLGLAISAIVFAAIILLAILPYNYNVDSIIYNIVFYRII